MQVVHACSPIGVFHTHAHTTQVWGVGIAHDGSYMASVSHDRSVRVWERTDEQVFLEEEKEKRLEEMFEKEAGKVRGQGVSKAKGACTSN